MGSFLIPVRNRVEDVTDPGTTLRLELVNYTDNDPSKAVSATLASWNIKLPEAQNPCWYYNFDSKAWTELGASTESDTHYSLLRNHLYTIGHKATNNYGGTDPGNPDNPDDPDPDEVPQDLTKGQTITLQINDNWELIHKMVVD